MGPRWKSKGAGGPRDPKGVPVAVCGGAGCGGGGDEGWVREPKGAQGSPREPKEAQGAPREPTAEGKDPKGDQVRPAGVQGSGGGREHEGPQESPR